MPPRQFEGKPGRLDTSGAPALMGGAPTVLVVSNQAEVAGGGELSLLGLLAAVDRTRWTPVVLVPGEGAIAARSRALGLDVQVIALPGLTWPRPAIVGTVRALARVARERGAALLHANGSRAMFYAGVAGRLARCPVVWHLRVLDRDVVLDWLLARLAARTIANSAAVRERLARWPSAHARTVVVPNGIELALFDPERAGDAARTALGLPVGVPVIGTVGRLVPFKGHRDLLAAVARLAGRGREVIALVVGDGPERAALERRSFELGIDRLVRFVGHRDDVAAALGGMDVFILPSLAEHFGRVLLEAMAMERPVVATRAGGVPEIVQDGATGVLVPPAAPAALADAIATLLDDPERARALGRAGRRRVAERYTLAQHADAVQAVWESIAR